MTDLQWMGNLLYLDKEFYVNEATLSSAWHLSESFFFFFDKTKYWFLKQACYYLIDRLKPGELQKEYPNQIWCLCKTVISGYAILNTNGHDQLFFPYFFLIVEAVQSRKPEQECMPR